MAESDAISSSGGSNDPNSDNDQNSHPPSKKMKTTGDEGGCGIHKEEESKETDEEIKQDSVKGEEEAKKTDEEILKKMLESSSDKFAGNEKDLMLQKTLEYETKNDNKGFTISVKVNKELEILLDREEVDVLEKMLQDDHGGFTNSEKILVHKTLQQWYLHVEVLKEWMKSHNEEEREKLREELKMVWDCLKKRLNQIDIMLSIKYKNLRELTTIYAAYDLVQKGSEKEMKDCVDARNYLNLVLIDHADAFTDENEKNTLRKTENRLKLCVQALEEVLRLSQEEKKLAISAKTTDEEKESLNLQLRAAKIKVYSVKKALADLKPETDKILANRLGLKTNSAGKKKD